MPIVCTSLKCADFRATKEVCWYSTPLSASQWPWYHSIRQGQRGNPIPALPALITTLEAARPESGSAARRIVARERLCRAAGLCNTTLIQTSAPPCRGEKSTVVAYHRRCAFLSVLVKGLQWKCTQCENRAKVAKHGETQRRKEAKMESERWRER